MASANATTITNVTADDAGLDAAYLECPLDKHGCYCCEEEYDGSLFNLTCRTDHKGRYCCGMQCSQEEIHPSNNTTDCFTSRDELRQAVEEYTSYNTTVSTAAYETYGAMPDWCVSPLDDMSLVFANLPPNFNENLGNWDVSNVKNMSYMFSGAFGYTGEGINEWDVSNVVDMHGMFADACCGFNADLSKWNTSSVIEMSQMFEYAQMFNQDVSMWDISSVRSMEKMFLGAKAFNQDLCAWGGSDAFPYSAVAGMFEDTACPSKEDPVEALKGPFCASTCDSLGSSSSVVWHLAPLSVALSLFISVVLK